jgi:CheY-like chemotaxis protein
VRSTALLFELQGFETDLAFDGRQAIERARKALPHLALLDLAMPDVDGFEVARTVRAMAPADPPLLVAVTGYAYPSDRKRCAEEAFDLHLSKPVDFGLLEQLAQTIKATRQGLAQLEQTNVRPHQAFGELLRVEIAMAHTFLDVALTTGNPETRARCLLKAQRTEGRWQARLGRQPSSDASLREGLNGLKHRLQDILLTPR